ncbi:MAG: DUF4062 domain-containing protein [Gammaproteobacteria bacterium]|nr:DUF4062 domain-containing protein [Gammaproteobacteria bacterium]
MPESTLWRPRPIFITSTFRDMQAERMQAAADRRRDR